jgi:transposase InsO family protein
MVYILTVVDVCSAYTLIRALPTKEMKSVARKLWEIFCKYRTPKIVQSDNRLEFVNQAIQVLMKLYGVDHQLITPYYPANRLVKQRNKKVERVLKKFTMGMYAAWNEWIPLVQISFNEAVSKQTVVQRFY